MIYIIPTKGGLGVEIWGPYEDLNNFYEVIGKFWNDENRMYKEGFDSRDALISGFSYEIRKAKEGSRLKRKSNHFTSEAQDHYGAQISWVHFLFSLTALKFNMRYSETNKFDIAQILLIEFWLEKALKEYDEIGAKKLSGYLEGGLYGGNDHMYQCMRSINYDFFLLGGGKRAFRKLPILMKRGVYSTQEYDDYQILLAAQAKKFNCKISQLELSDDDFDYENVKW